MSFNLFFGLVLPLVSAFRSSYSALPCAVGLSLTSSLLLITTPAIAQISLPPPAFAPASSPTVLGETREIAARNVARNVEPSIRYLVYTTPATDRRLAQVRRFVPNASFGDLSGDLVIQVGLFESETAASERLLALASQGIASEILQVQVNPPRPATLPEADVVEDDRGYYVIVPGKAGELDGLAASLRSLLGETTIAVLDRPYGTHIAIGPFEVRDDAQLVEDLLRDRDVSNARVYYDRGGSRSGSR